MKERKDVGAYMKQYNKELKAELKQCVKAYEMKVKEYKKLYEENKRLQNNRNKAIGYIEKDLQISILPNNQIINGTEVVKRINKIEDILKGGSDE